MSSQHRWNGPIAQIARQEDISAWQRTQWEHRRRQKRILRVCDAVLISTTLLLVGFLMTVWAVFAVAGG